jgi:F-box domain
MSSLTSLPHIQMLGKIMRYLPLEDHLNFPKVCKSWYKYSSTNDFKLESNIRDIWKSYLACEILLNKLLNPNYDRKYFRIHIINNDICVLGKSSFYNIANMWLLFKTYAWANKKELLWMSNPDNERLKLMNQKNLEIMQGKHDYEGEIAYRPKNYGNLKDFDGNANFDYRFIK